MTKKMKKPASRLAAILTSLMMVVVFTPAFAFAEAAPDITVYMTVSDQGVLAKAKDGSVMAWKEVTVKDVDGDGHHNFHEALVAAHAEYNSADGYEVNSTSGWVSKMWGKSVPAGSSFITNNKTEMSVVTETEIKDGYHLVASNNQDETLYSDWNSYFNKYEVTVATGEEFTLQLEGAMAMTVNEPAAARNVSIGTWENGNFVKIAGKKTNNNGKVNLTFDDKGTKVVTASGSVQDILYGEPGYVLTKAGRDKDDKIIYGKINWTTYESYIGHTSKDYGEGPYSWDDIEWTPLTDFDKDTWDNNTDGFLLYSDELLVNCPIIAPACIVNVVSPEGKAVINQIDALPTADAIKLTDKDAVSQARNAYNSLGENQADVDDATLARLTEAEKAIKSLEDKKAEKDRARAEIAKQIGKVKAVKIVGLKVKAGKKKANVKWKKNTTVSGYEIYYKKPGSKAKSVKINNNATTKKVVKKLTKGKKYTFKVRGFKKINGNIVYGKWSKTKKVKIK